MTDFFSERELRCRCGCGLGKSDMDPKFMEMLNWFRGFCDFPFPVTSAIRCIDYNNHVSSSGNDGPHVQGVAVDIKLYGFKVRKLLDSLNLFWGITGIGLYQKGPRRNRYIHLDTCINTPNRPRPWVWTY